MVRCKGPFGGTSASGSIGGVLTYLEGPRGTSLRRNVGKKKSRTPAQYVTRRTQGFLAASWKLLSDAEREAWGRAGHAIGMAGYHFFLMYNGKRFARGAGISAIYPALETLDPMALTNGGYEQNGQMIRFKSRVNSLGDAWCVQYNRQVFPGDPKTHLSCFDYDEVPPGFWSYTPWRRWDSGLWTCDMRPIGRDGQVGPWRGTMYIAVP